MVSDTRSEFLVAARRQFAEKGFYGASIAGIAGELGVTKQALLHHFGSKEKLYGEVLQQISDGLLSGIIQASAGTAKPESELEALLVRFHEKSVRQPEETQLLMREVLDNKRRAERAGSWYLKPFLDALVALVRQVPGWRDADEPEILAAIFQLFGAINYFVISEPTLSRMFGKPTYRQVKAVYAERLRRLIRATLDHPPASTQ